MNSFSTSKQSFWIKVTFVCLLSLPSFSYGQDFKLSLEKMREQYERSVQLHIQMNIQAFEQETDKTPFYNQQAEIFRDRQNYYYQMEDQNMLMNDRHIVMINKTNREIVCRSRDINNEQKFQAQDFTNLDSLLKKSGTPEYMGKKNKLEHYRFTEKKGEIERIDLYFSSVTGLVHEISYRYKSGQLAKIKFILFDLNPTLPADTFNEKKYVILSQGKYKGTGNYSNYLVHQ